MQLTPRYPLTGQGAADELTEYHEEIRYQKRAILSEQDNGMKIMSQLT
jgi:hypothetical protein